MPGLDDRLDVRPFKSRPQLALDRRENHGRGGRTGFALPVKTMFPPGGLCRVAGNRETVGAFHFDGSFAVGGGDVAGQQMPLVGGFHRVRAFRRRRDRDAVAEPLVCERRRRAAVPDARMAGQRLTDRRRAGEEREFFRRRADSRRVNDGLLNAVPIPSEFVPVTLQLTSRPRSALPTMKVGWVAPGMGSPPSSHWNVKVGAGAPVHVLPSTSASSLRLVRPRSSVLPARRLRAGSRERGRCCCSGPAHLRVLRRSWPSRCTRASTRGRRS